MKAPARCPRCEADFKVNVPSPGTYQTQCVEDDCRHWFQFEAEAQGK